MTVSIGEGRLFMYLLENNKKQKPEEHEKGSKCR